MPARTLYAAQQAKITPYAGGTKQFPVQSASCELTIPVDDILILGKLGSAGRFQKEVATCKADLKIFMGTDNADANTVLGSFLGGLTGEALAGNVSTVEVAPDGFAMSGIVSSIGLELSKGNFGMVDLSFVGVGEPNFAASPTSIGGAGTQPASAVAVVPLTTGAFIYAMNGTGKINACPNSIKFSLDIPNEVISCVGGRVSGTQLEVAADNVQVAKPPFKGTLTVEGTSAAGSKKVVFGEANACITVTMNDATIISQSFNQAAGEVGATYNFTVEGTDINIT